MRKTIKLQEYWVSDNLSSDPSKNKVYKALGFKVEYCERYYQSKKVTMLFDKNGKMFPIYTYDSDIQIFNTEDEAIKYQNKRKEYWLDWYKKEIEIYKEKLNKYK